MIKNRMSILKLLKSKVFHTLFQSVWGLFLLFSVSSCDSFLDTLPDNRAQINSEKKITQLLVSAYPNANYSVLAELSSDNFVDNNAILPVNLSSFDRMHEEIYSWNAVTSSTQEDSPSYVWERCYAAIAAANHALQAIDELETAQPALDFSAQRGEALLCRAYSHFILVNMFCQAYKDETLSAADLGIPYATEPETTVEGNYTRETVQSVYSKIQKDIEDGFPLISDRNYTVPKYHFNRKAAAAFAARFYLYKRDYQKVVDYANEALTATPASLMRDWNKSYDNILAIAYDYINSESACNFLILPTSSVFNRIFGTRYGHNGAAIDGSTYGSGPTWSGMLPAFIGKLYISVQQDYGVFFPKSYEMFEYTDKVAGIGYAHVVRAEFTAEETLLCRAEALVYLNRIPEAVADLQVWNNSHLAPNELTEAVIRGFYVSTNSLFVKALNNDKMSPNFVVTANQRPLIHCILHFRRIETMFDGYRWFDIKRYGIEIEHAIAKTGTDKLTYNDPRRALQLPQEVISAGLEPNPAIRTVVPTSNFRLLQE
jgi:hypothetical protein